MFANAKNIAVHQTLHGYDRGHHLLAGSLDLPTLAARRLQIATDLSGPAIVPGFESYLTGFPLDNSYYAIARTWYADEMPRPGCVWTHTLLLRLRDVRQVRHLEMFLRYFRRPTLGESLEAYTQVLWVDSVSPSAGEVVIDDRACAMIAALYSSRDRTVLVPSAAASDFDAVVLALWQIHPTWLRRAFSFCTGALSLAYAGTARDLLVVPESLARRQRNDALLAVATRTEPYSWLAIIKDQLSLLRPNHLLRALASDVVRDRTSIRDVAEVMALAQAANVDIATVSAALKLTADRFPAPLDARQLKTALLDPKKRLLSAGPGYLLEKLTTQDQVLEAFAPGRKILARLVQDSYRERPFILLQLAERLIQSRGSSAISRAAVAIVTARDLSTTPNEVVVEALRLSSKRSRSVELWAALGERGDAIVRVAADQEQTFPPHRWADVLTGVLTSGVEVDVRRPMLDLMPAAMIRDVLARTPLANASSTTRESLLAVLLAKPVVMSQLLASARAGDWLELAVDFLYSRPAQLTPIVPSLCRLTAAAGSAAADLHPFVALLGLREANVELVPCILRAATKLNETLADKPARRLQDLADRELPSIGRPYDWDLCERLCHALTTRFVDGSWSPDLLLSAVDDSELFRSIVRVASYSKVGRRWLDRLRHSVLTRRIPAAAWQRRIVLN